jgi:anti-sigma factor RsiW
MHLDPQDEERLSAYLDGELSSDEQARVEQLLADEPAARQLLDELRAVSSTLQGLPRTRVPGDLAADVLREIERRGVQRGSVTGSRKLSDAVADAVGSAATDGERSGAAEITARAGAKPADAAKPAPAPYVEEPVDWRGRLIRPLVYAGIAVAVFAAVSLMTERAGDNAVHVAQQPGEERAADVGRALTERDETDRVDKAERSGGTVFDTDHKSEKVGKEDALHRSGMQPDRRFAAPATAAGQNGAGDGAAQMAEQAADPRAFYIQQAVANGEPVLVVQCRVTPEAVRQDIVGKLLLKNMVAIDDEAAAELDTAINTNVGYGQAVAPSPDSVVVQQNAAVEQSAMPANGAAGPEMPTDLAAQQQSPGQQADAQDNAAPADIAADLDQTNGDRDNQVAAKHRGEPAGQSGESFELNGVAGGSAAVADEPTVYLIDASPEQLEGVLADLKSQTEGVVSVSVSPAPEAPTQNDYINYNRGASAEAVVIADEAAPLLESAVEPAAEMPAESATNLFTEPAAQKPAVANAPAPAPGAPAAAPSAAPAPMAPAASQMADQQPPVDLSLHFDQNGRRIQRRVANADEVRLQVQALGVLEEQLQNSPARNAKLDRYGNSSRARKLRPDTLSNFTPAANGAAPYGQAPALYGQTPALANQANQAAAVNAPPQSGDTPAAGAALNTSTLDAEAAAPQAAAAQAADAAQAAGAESSRMAVRKAGQRAGQMLQRAVIVLEVQPPPAAPAKQE